jgi:hypothetical protein
VLNERSLNVPSMSLVYRRGVGSLQIANHPGDKFNNFILLLP